MMRVRVLGPDCQNGKVAIFLPDRSSGGIRASLEMELLDALELLHELTDKIGAA